MIHARTASHRPAAGLAVVALLAILALVAPAAALAGDDRIKLALLPVGQPGSFFDLTMAPGETRTLAVDIGNDGTETIAARTYAADVYTIINGGFGGRLRNEAQTETTTWLGYPTEVLDLAPGQRAGRSFAVVVPASAGPGEYISSIVLENDRPISDDRSVGIDQVYRQAIAVVVTVPGARAPGLVIGDASHLVVAGASVVRVAVDNTGNIRLKPAIGFTLTDPGGTEVSRATMQMDTFYARTSTFVEFPLAALLRPGTYHVRLTAEDASQGAEANAAALPLVVEASAAAVGPEGGLPGLIGVLDGASGDPLVALAIALATVIAVALAVAGTVVVRGRRRARDEQAG